MIIEKNLNSPDSVCINESLPISGLGTAPYYSEDFNSLTLASGALTTKQEPAQIVEGIHGQALSFNGSQCYEVGNRRQECLRE